jgi:alcohol dehydrogenase class IV
MSAEYFNPVQSVYGAGALSSLPRLLDGRRAALVTFPEARAIGLLDRMESVLHGALACTIDQYAAQSRCRRTRPALGAVLARARG